MVNANLASNPRFSSPEGAPFCLNHFQEEDLELITSKLHHLKISQ
ncbi:hypothetical protein LEP1GSC084_0158 [Leptospira interrogans serovar Medanensis str. L0448]|nr:hypothetical protein LEP1GSC099_1047 [Leptospira interrogans str. UI 08452]EMN34977.1 hypothetical protein LEP1GSC084_0158 [Leptospira interrogans serovar Medanensis str. L0448]EMN41966.1 hypothetical protein LEP1GSC085_4804 [Leptospira interrogans str. L0996]EMO92052.1 hypothetical protein LEP1GSC109_1198 [Leptospira interrogans str. UI 13372]